MVSAPADDLHHRSFVHEPGTAQVCQAPVSAPSWMHFGAGCFLLANVCLAEDANSTITIGLLLSQAEESASLRHGAMVAVEEANRTPGPKARLVTRGRPGQWGTEGDEAAALALDEEVDAIITPLDGTAAHQVLQVAGRTRVPVASLSADTSVTGAGIPWAVRILSSTVAEAKSIFTGLTNPGAPLRWLALVPPDRAGREAARDLAEAASALGMKWQEPLRLQPRSANRQRILDQLTAANPDAVLLWTDPATAGEWARHLRDAAFNGHLAGPSPLRSDAFLRHAGAAAEGLVAPGFVSEWEDGAQMRRFQQEYRRQFSREPDVLALMSHDAAWLMIQLLKKSAQAPILHQFPLTGVYSGASGTIQFDRNGNRLGSLTLLVCQGGRFEPLPSKSTRLSARPAPETR